VNSQTKSMNGFMKVHYPIPEHIQEAIDIADKRMYVSEGMTLVRNFTPLEGVTPADFTINPQPWERAERMFLERHTSLKARRGRRVA